MSTRFAPWIVLACIGTLAGCTSSEGEGPSGNVQMTIIIPNGAQGNDLEPGLPTPDGNNGSTAPSLEDLQVVEYTIACNDGDPANVNGPFLANGAGFDDNVVISGVAEVLDNPTGPRPTPDFGKPLEDVYVVEGFMDLPPKRCTAQLRARTTPTVDNPEGEVVCTDTVTFEVAVDAVTQVNILMICGISFQAPVGQLDLGGGFQFEVGNFCPDLFILNCIDREIDVRSIPGIGETAATACQVRFRDGDSTCGDNCDPQTCEIAPEGLRCSPAPEPLTCVGGLNPGIPCTTAATESAECPGDPSSAFLPNGDCVAGVNTIVKCGVVDPASNEIVPDFRCAIPGPLFGTGCTPAPGDTCFDLSSGAACVPGAVMDCTGTNTPAPGCAFAPDTLGSIGAPAPGPLNPGEGGFFVACVLADNDGDAQTPDVPVSPGALITCRATTTDGDTDCDKVKEYELTCPGFTACQTFGGDAACQAASTTVCEVGTCNDATCDGVSAAACCDYAPVPDSPAVDCSAECGLGNDCETSPGQCVGGVCTSQNCNDPAVGCPPDTECTSFTCEPGGSCTATPNTGAPCNGGTGVCQADGVTCLNNCDPSVVVCDDLNECTDNVCDDSTNPGTCSYPTNDANFCTTCPSGTCICSGGACIDGCTVPAPKDQLGIPMACRNSFQVKAVSEFPIDLTNITAVDDVGAGSCIEAGQPVNFDIDPIIALDTAFLQAAANTLCGLGTPLTQADVTLAQIAIDAVAGATCTEQLSELPNTPQTVIIDATVNGVCGAGGSVTINSGISLPLPQVTLPCTAGAAGTDALQICSVGTTPIQASIDLATPPTQTFVGVSVGGGNINIVFQCGTSSTTNPSPGVENQIGCALPNPVGPCDDVVGEGNTGEELPAGSPTTYPVSNCDFLTPPATPQDCGGFDCPGTCTTVPIAVDPATVCATFDVQ